eukprot:896182_1
MIMSPTLQLTIIHCLGLLSLSSAFQQQQPFSVGRSLSQDGRATRQSSSSITRLHEMKRPILDRLATFVFRLENDRVENSSVVDSKGRAGEPMEWAEENSFANQL